MLPWQFASLFVREPLAALFFQKARPALAAFYAPIAPLGFRAYAVAHVLVAATAIPMIASVAARLGQRHPNVPAFVLATSPLLLLTAPGGHSNADAVAGFVFALWLLVVRERPVAAGAVLGAMLLARAEIAPLAAAVVVGEVVLRDRRILLGAALPLILYPAAGAVYHQDLLWFVHYPPALPAPIPMQWERNLSFGEQLAGLRDTALTLSPAIGVCALVAPRALGRRERALTAGLVAFLVAIRCLPLVGTFNFDWAPRYTLPALPTVALLVGRAFEQTIDHRAMGALGVTAITATIAAAAWGAAADPLVAALAAWGACAGLLWARRPHAALALCAAWTLASQPLWPPRTRLLSQQGALATAEAWWRREAGSLPAGTSIVTNVHLLHEWLARRGLLDEHRTRIRFLVQFDTVRELETLLDRRVGQRDAILSALQGDFFGQPIFAAADREVEAWPQGTVAVFGQDDRLALSIDLERWRERLEILSSEDGVTIGRLLEPGARPKRPAAEAVAQVRGQGGTGAAAAQAPRVEPVEAPLPAPARAILGALDVGTTMPGGWSVANVSGPKGERLAEVSMRRAPWTFEVYATAHGATAHAPPVTTASHDLFYTLPRRDDGASAADVPATEPLAVLCAIAERVEAQAGEAGRGGRAAPRRHGPSPPCGPWPRRRTPDHRSLRGTTPRIPKRRRLMMPGGSSGQCDSLSSARSRGPRPSTRGGLADPGG